ncbi:MAG: hypothetical protein K8T90_00905 [Planctomycetes bacterium]|nr:hypothetical protein [Planctomycetota bacterium]
MKIRSAIAALAVVVLSVPVLAADKEPLTLSDGVTGMAEILATDAESVTARFVRKGVDVEAKVRAIRMDPISFYEIRRAHMESTAENHVNLAIHCAENGMLHQARFQMDMARALDPDIEQKFKDRPNLMEAIAARLADAAKRLVADGRLRDAYDVVQVLATRFTETAAAADAYASLDLIETKLAERDAARVAARQKKAADAKDAAVRAVAEKREAVVAALENQRAGAQKLESQALRQRNTTNAKHGHEAAAEAYAALLTAIGTAKAAATADADLGEMIREVERVVRSEGADALVNVGSVELARSNFDRAEDVAKAALAVDPGSARASSLLESVDIAREQADELRNLKLSRERRPTK